MLFRSGFRCVSGGVLICADREESDATAKRAIDKIHRFSLQQGSFVIAGAGRSSVLANTFTQLEIALRAADGNGSDLFLAHRAVINRVLREIYKEFVWGQNEEGERGVALIISAAFNKPHSIPFLYGTDDDIVYPHSLYGCSGIGQDLAYYFADRLYDPSQTRQQAILLAAFIFDSSEKIMGKLGLG